MKSLRRNVLRDLDLDLDLFTESKKIYILYIWNFKLNRKNVWETFVDFDICHRMVSLGKMQSVTLTYFMKVHIFYLDFWNGNS